MATRLLSEHLVKKQFPHLRYIRIHTEERNKAVIYAWDEDLQLPDKEIANLKKFASGFLSPYVCFNVKAYHMVQEDGVPQVGELPQSIVQVAMNRSLNQQTILTVINNVLSSGRIAFDRYDLNTGTLHFSVQSGASVPEIEKELIQQYLYEFVPLGSSYSVTYG